EQIARLSSRGEIGTLRLAFVSSVLPPAERPVAEVIAPEKRAPGGAECDGRRGGRPSNGFTLRYCWPTGNAPIALRIRLECRGCARTSAPRTAGPAGSMRLTRSRPIEHAASCDLCRSGRDIRRSQASPATTGACPSRRSPTAVVVQLHAGTRGESRSTRVPPRSVPVQPSAWAPVPRFRAAEPWGAAGTGCCTRWHAAVAGAM
ncbi:hypothetical protein DF118_19555, partial [Burkholderia stagnalis]